MKRLAVLAAATVWIAIVAGRANAQSFTAELMIVHTAMGNPTGGGMAWLELSADQKKLSYTLAFEGLDLEPIAANRTDPEDIVGIHLHLMVPDQIGPHVLNIFGIPAEDDADLVVDYENEWLSGVFDISDASKDPETNEILPQFFPLTTKIIDDWIDDLIANQLYLAIHTAGQNGNALLHGDVVLVPEPAPWWPVVAAVAWRVNRRRNRAVPTYSRVQFI